VIELDPKQVTAHNTLGAAYNAKGQYDEAISALKEAIALPRFWDELEALLRRADTLPTDPSAAGKR
jgi:hypothetical protein